MNCKSYFISLIMNVMSNKAEYNLTCILPYLFCHAFFLFLTDERSTNLDPKIIRLGIPSV